jgi:hypothetical protein
MPLTTAICADSGEVCDEYTLSPLVSEVFATIEQVYQRGNHVGWRTERNQEQREPRCHDSSWSS